MGTTPEYASLDYGKTDPPPTDPGPTSPADIQGKLLTALQMFKQVHDHMTHSHVHDCRKQADGLKILKDIQVAMRDYWPK